MHQPLGWQNVSKVIISRGKIRNQARVPCRKSAVGPDAGKVRYAMIPYPQFSPTLISLGPLQIRWYGLMYILGFVAGFAILKKRAKETDLRLDADTLSDFAFYIFMGVLLGGRLGYVLFYNPLMFLMHPLEIFALWHGGMSFHGGLIGTIWGGLLFSYTRGIPFYRIADAVIPAIPIGLGLGRLGNFINGELWGRATDVSWAMQFPTDPLNLPRHPSQLYEFALEGVVLFLILWFMRTRNLPSGVLFWSFFGFYGTFRIIAEFFREPDAQLSFIMPNITAGMLLSVPMVVVGFGFVLWQLWRCSRTRPGVASLGA
jgi:phosphatidylglycerol:prolipoprotein diacylglycerol transferase